ncbi:nucleoside-diphosphate-sugar epimerase [Algoriphagus ratkowskyi]|uniref:NAD-dependent epimerase/dehydratase family protein n=1 Tax=Algoriphagus ratkowskyi TaxID=57028 RepID=A0A2W7RN72_9BACT|nr:NAD-dependent epimerase/dehydratase family protein [Algoriphagus ratkowskyi]PZX59910.1 nucleoside-diphosphate-sugar epimerase [Algoriphagus ratkowskyi]TXD78387.1 NAD-dependent epimerase/dehydratase family protein [Algoriphagus ratkowskyi]
MNILITGITGLFGSYLAKEFASLGEIHGFRRTNSSLRLLAGNAFPITWYEGELSDMESLENALEDIDLVIHAAGKVSFAASEKDSLHRDNVEGTTNLVNAMLNTGVKKLVHISSVSAIGRSPELTQLDENFKWTESPLNTDYGISKYLAELEAWRGEQEGLDLIVVNPSILLGKVDDDRSSTDIYHYVIEENSYYPKGDLNYIDVRDAAKQVRELVEKEAWGERFILNNESISYKEFFEKMAVSFGKKAPSKAVSPIMLKTVVFLNTILRKLGLSKNPLNTKTAMISQQKVYFDNSKVNKLLNSSYHSLEETLDWSK